MQGALSQPQDGHKVAHHDPIDDDDASYEQLKHLLEEREARNLALTTQLEDMAGSKKKEESDHALALAAKSEEVEILRSELASAQKLLRSGESEKSWREAERKLRLQLSSKDIKLRQLKDAIKALEQKLVDALKQTADE